MTCPIASFSNYRKDAHLIRCSTFQALFFTSPSVHIFGKFCAKNTGDDGTETEQ